MSAITQPYGFACRGGLDVNLSQLELLAEVGKATVLRNFEVDPDGGYRRINGYTPYGTTRPNGANKVLGVLPYADGVLVASGTNIYFTTDGTTWIEISRTGMAALGTGDSYAAFTALALSARTNQGQVEFTYFEDDTAYGKVIICDGANSPYIFYVSGGSVGNMTTYTYHAAALNVASATGFSDDPVTACYHKTMVVAAGMSSGPNRIAYTTFNSQNPDATVGAAANYIAVDDAVVALRSFREDIIIFCENSIHKLINVETHGAATPEIAVVPIAKNVGCLSRYSIQELGGDLIFLAPDGFRTIAGTERIGDVELGSVSRQIQPIVRNMVQNLGSFDITSVVLRDKSQYRFFYSDDANPISEALGFIGTLTPRGMEWSETMGIEAKGIGYNYVAAGTDSVYHGDGDGYIYTHNSGDLFYDAGVSFNIDAKYVSPFMDFGDLGTRKTVVYIKSSFSVEGSIQPTLRVVYDYESGETPQPIPYVLTQVPTPSVFGTALFGTAEFGGVPDPAVRQAVEGSGHTVSLEVTVNDNNSPFSINGFYIDYYPSGRR